ncbi:aminotransferase class-III [Hypoxylon trugodes]|uniref:aminotransferase class-III n=1 Tax=Hypoxylon trugodes TaxID=326681 RepID=UPI0021A211F8|nr:aminotransferase class-III [Hypoxylon trugodes]KAI1390868.1 aminotransferase class-III [Hypoxylon trugodes]
MATVNQGEVDFKTNIADKLARHIDVYVKENTKSKEFNQDASDTLPGGTTRAVLSQDPFPISFSGGRDAYLTSLDGHEYLDFVSEYCAGMFGHSHPQIIEAIEATAKSGFVLGGPTPKEGELAKLLVERFPSIDAIRFCNSGTEANTMAIATALAYTHRKKVLVFERGYHGGTLSFSHANPLNLPHQFVYGIYNDIAKTKQKIDIEIGVILIEPVQFAGGAVPAAMEFLQFLRDEATRIGAVLIFDEVVTSRAYYGGMQSQIGITPDMTTLGKHFGGGLPFGAFGGKRHIMELFDPRSPRGIVAVKPMTREALERTNRYGEAIRTGLREIFAKSSAEATIVGFGNVIGIRLLGPDGSNLGRLFYFYLLSKRIYIGSRGFLALNLLHDQEHVNRVLSTTQEFADEVLHDRAYL